MRKIFLDLVPSDAFITLRCRARLLRFIVVLAFALLSSGFFAHAEGTVTNCTQAGLSTALNGGGVVTFSCDGTIVLTNTITIATNTTLDGSGRTVAISGNNAVRLFEVDPSVNFTLIHLTIADGRHTGPNGLAETNRVNGEPGFGAGIYNNGGDLTLFNCTLANNSSVGGNGAIETSSFQHGGAGGTAQGGAIFSAAGSVYLSNCTVSANNATGGNGGGGTFSDDVSGGSASGGAIYGTNAQIILISTSFSSNGASGGAPGGFGPNVGGPSGGAYGGSMCIRGGHLSARNSTFSSNIAAGADLPSIVRSGAVGPAEGGAIFITNATAEFVRSLFATNTALSGKKSLNGTVGYANGGAICNQGTLSISSSGFYGNRAVGRGGSEGYGAGGAVSTSASLTLVDSALAGNSVQGSEGGAQSAFAFPGAPGMGGGIFNQGVAAITNSTIAQNMARGGDSGAGISSMAAGGDGTGGGLFNRGVSVAFANVTLADNNALGGVGNPAGASSGGGLRSTNGTITLINSIVANNQSGSNCFGNLTDGGHNISSDASCNFSSAGSLNNTDPKLAPLADNGGPTPTMALLPDSPAIDAADNAFCPPTDQRGFPRPSGRGCDMGAFEYFGTYRVVLHDAQIQICFFCPTNRTCSVLATTNLLTWQTIGSLGVGDSGIACFEETNASSYPLRFYKISDP